MSTITASTELEIEKRKSSIAELESRIQSFEEKIVEYEDNKEAIENLEELLAEKGQGNKLIQESEQQLVHRCYYFPHFGCSRQAMATMTSGWNECPFSLKLTSSPAKIYKY